MYKARSYIYFYIFIILFLLVFAPRFNILTSPLLDKDDAVYLGQRLMGIYEPSFSIKDNIYDLSIKYFGLSGTRLMIMFGVCMSGLFIYSAFVRAGMDRYISAIIVMAGAAVPSSGQNYIFVTGTHALRALIPAAIGLSLLYFYARDEKTFSNIWKALLAGSLFWLAGHFSPLGILVGLAGLIFLYWPARKRAWLKTAVIALVAILSAAIEFYVRLFSKAQNHYLDAQGFMDFSIGSLLRRSIKYLLPFYDRVTNWTPASLIAGGVVGLVAFVIIWRFGVETRERKHTARLPDWTFPAALLAGAALAYAPVLALTNFSDRYYGMAAAFGVWGACGLAGVALSSRAVRRRALPVMASSLLGLSVSWSIAEYRVTQQLYAELDALSTALARELPQEARGWPKESQVLVLVEDDKRYRVNGYNHWSTGRLRFYSGRPDIIGLLGDTSRLEQNPFVEEWRAFGEEYRFVNGAGRASRARMIGLETDRPTFVYRYDQESGLQRLEGLVLDHGEEGLHVIPFGERPDQSSYKPASVSICDSAQDMQNWVVYRMPQPKTAPLEIPEAPGREFEGENQTRVELSTNEIQSFVLTMELRSDEKNLRRRSNFGEEYPPMPALWQPLRIEQREADSIDVILNGQKIIVPAGDQPVRLRFSGQRDCHLTLSAGEETIRFLGDNWLSSNFLEIGNGFNHRYWEGKIDNFRLEIESVDGDQRVYTFDDLPLSE